VRTFLALAVQLYVNIVRLSSIYPFEVTVKVLRRPLGVRAYHPPPDTQVAVSVELG